MGEPSAHHATIRQKTCRVPPDRSVTPRRSFRAVEVDGSVTTVKLRLKQPLRPLDPVLQAATKLGVLLALTNMPADRVADNFRNGDIVHSSNEFQLLRLLRAEPQRHRLLRLHTSTMPPDLPLDKPPSRRDTVVA